MNKEDLKILIVYVNSYMDHLIPVSVSSIAGSLRHAGFTNIKLFDTTYYKPETDTFGEALREETGQVKSACLEDEFFPTCESDVVDDFETIVKEYSPDLIAFSIVEPTFLLSKKLVNRIAHLNIPVIAGGIHVIFDPKGVLSENGITMVCTGEGEKSLVELCNKIINGDSSQEISGIWFKQKDGSIKMNPNVSLINFAERGFVMPNYDIFHEKRFYRPMSGKIYKMLPLEFSRGCPHKCAYCGSPALAKNFQSDGKWLRMKPMDIVEQEIKYCIDNYNVDYFYFISETFLAVSEERFSQFIEMYSKYKVPFWMNTRPETITEEKIKILEDLGCHRMSVGVECGNSEYRKKMLKRGSSNKKIVEALTIVAKSNIEVSVNNIIGLPDETREMVFETIELNRQFNADSHSVLIFQPFRGTFLYDYCVEKGYYDADSIAEDILVGPVIKSPYMSDEEIMGLYRTFNLYAKLPKERWPEIKRAEKNDEEGNRIFKELIKEIA